MDSSSVILSNCSFQTTTIFVLCFVRRRRECFFYLFFFFGRAVTSTKGRVKKSYFISRLTHKFDNHSRLVWSDKIWNFPFEINTSKLRKSRRQNPVRYRHRQISFFFKFQNQITQQNKRKTWTSSAVKHFPFRWYKKETWTICRNRNSF